MHDNYDKTRVDVENGLTDSPRIIANPVARYLVMACGWFFTVLAFFGAMLPILPTTPFLLLAAACFYRSSGKFYQWIMYNKLFGHYLRDYKAGMGVPVRVKVTTLVFTWISSMVSVIFFIPYLWLKILVIAISAAITIHILLIRTRK
jgi:hypothetical protein